MRKIILTGAVLAMLTSAAPMVHAQVDPGVQAKKDYDAKIQELEGKVGKVDSLDEKINNIQQGLDNKITANKELIQGDDGKGGLQKDVGGLKGDIKKLQDAVGDDNSGLQKEVNTIKATAEAQRHVLTTLDTMAKENKKLLVGDDGNGGLKNDVKENKKLLVGDNGNGGLKKDVEDLKRVVGENDTEGLQKSVKENTNKITEVESEEK